MKLSIVATLYQSSPYIEEFCRRAKEVGERMFGEEYEIVLVNDGSPDDGLDHAIALSTSDPHIILIDLSRNFGHHKAMMTGLAHARGEHVFLIDSDLEEEPEWLEQFWKRLHQEECDVVYGVQEQRKGGVVERISGDWFYRVFKLLTGLTLTGNLTTARLMTRRYVDALVQHDEREIFIAGLWMITGFEQRPHVVRKHSNGTTTYTVGRKIAILINSITAFSNAPLIGIFYVGATIFLISLIYTSVLVINWLFFARPLSGWTSVMVSIWLMGGLLISFVGIVGIYISKIFSETKRRPYTIVRQIYGGQQDENAG